MEVEELSKKISKEVDTYYTESEKRKIWIERVDDFLTGNNLLCMRLDRMVEINIDPVDLEKLLDRIMQEDDVIAIKNMMNGLLVPNDTQYLKKSTPYEMEMREWGQRVKKADETKDEEDLRLDAIEYEKDRPNPFVNVFFCRFDPKASDNSHWGKFYKEYSKYLLNGNMNLTRLSRALKENMLIDVAYTIYKDEIIRFNILEPFSSQKKGFPMLVPKPK